MEFIELYDSMIELWPEEIDISDGYPTGENGFMFPTLSKIHDEIENRINHEKDHWGNVGVWSFFQAFHDRAKELREAGETTLKTRDVSKTDIDNCIKSNLEPSKWGDDWAEERKSYKGLA
jgi:hypothetical protein